MLSILRDNPLLLLFLVAGIGYPLGRIKIGQAHLGVAAVLFVGLAFGALDPSLKLPEIVYQFGLALFVYCIGLSSGPGFVNSLKGRGLRDNLFSLSIILLTAILSLIPHVVLGLRPAETAGIFTGINTSTPALAAVVEYLKQLGLPETSDPVVGYSIAYPVSILGMILAIYLAERFFKVDYAAEARSLRGMAGVSDELINRTICVEHEDAIGRTVIELVAHYGWKVNFGRIVRGSHCEVVGYGSRLEQGDLVTTVGTPEEVERVAQALGRINSAEADLDRSEVDYRHFFVSDPNVVGRPLRELQLTRRFGAVITRVWRGDFQLRPHADLMLELGDRVRVLTRLEKLDDVARFLGDSYKAISEIDIAVLGLGMAMGIGLGLLPITLPGGITIHLGLAGGPLIVALILGAQARTGSLVWSLPYSANMLLRQLGLTIFLATVGTRSGYDFAQTLSQTRGWLILGGSATIVLIAGLTMLYVGYRFLKIPMAMLTGMLAGTQTQAATLGFALEQAGNDLPNVGYAVTYPAAMVFKIVLAQVFISLLM